MNLETRQSPDRPPTQINRQDLAQREIRGNYLFDRAVLRMPPPGGGGTQLPRHSPQTPP